MRISDWSSDVCSSDLSQSERSLDIAEGRTVGIAPWDARVRIVADIDAIVGLCGESSQYFPDRDALLPAGAASAAVVGRGYCPYEIGRASCRARVCQYV